MNKTGKSFSDAAKFVVIVRGGMVETVYGSSTISSVDIQILDMDTTVSDEIRSTEALEKQASDTLVKIYG